MKKIISMVITVIMLILMSTISNASTATESKLENELGINQTMEQTTQIQLPRTRRNYLGLFLLLGVEIAVASGAIYFGKKKNLQIKNKKIIVTGLAIALSMQFI